MNEAHQGHMDWQGQTNRQERMKQMLRKGLQSMSSLEERSRLKELLDELFFNLTDTNVLMYKQLEERVMSGRTFRTDQYLIRTGLVERRLFDPTNPLMTVMDERDLIKRNRSAGEIRQIIAEAGKCLLGTVFLTCDYRDIRDMLRGRPKLHGIVGAAQNYRVSMMPEQNRRYLEKIEQLYHLFTRNGIAWQTINSPYLFKLVDIYITELPEECDDREWIRSFQVDFGAYAPSVRYDMAPIWNVWHEKLGSTAVSAPCKDHKNYEHEITLKESEAGYAYLLSGKSGINSMRRNGQRILFVSQKSKAQDWNVWSIRNGNEGRTTRYTYPVMENFRTNGLAEWFQWKRGQMIKNGFELEQFIRGLGVEDYLIYKEYRFSDHQDALFETYPVNFFLKDEVRRDKQQRRLSLIFGTNQNQAAAVPWLLRDLMSFVVSEVQELFPEYECGGELE